MVQGCARARTRLPDRAATAAADRSGAAAGLGEHAATLLQSLFSVQGALTDAQAAAVASRAGCSIDDVRAGFRSLQSGAQSVVRRAGERAAEAAEAAAAANGGSAHGGGAHGSGSAVALAAAAADPARVQAALGAAAAERQAALGKLRRLINEPGDGGLRDAGATGERHGAMALASMLFDARHCVGGGAAPAAGGTPSPGARPRGARWQHLHCPRPRRSQPLPTNPTCRHLCVSDVRSGQRRGARPRGGLGGRQPRQHPSQACGRRWAGQTRQHVQGRRLVARRGHVGRLHVVPRFQGLCRAPPSFPTPHAQPAS